MCNHKKLSLQQQPAHWKFTTSQHFQKWLSILKQEHPESSIPENIKKGSVSSQRPSKNPKTRVQVLLGFQGECELLAGDDNPPARAGLGGVPERVVRLWEGALVLRCHPQPQQVPLLIDRLLSQKKVVRQYV